MCINCWTELEIEPVVNAKVIRAYKLIAELYETEGGGCGGVGHIVFDDWNVEDASIDYCLDRCNAEELEKVIGGEAIEASRAALLYFRILTEHERYTALAFHGKELDIFQFVECL